MVIPTLIDCCTFCSVEKEVAGVSHVYRTRSEIVMAPSTHSLAENMFRLAVGFLTDAAHVFKPQGRFMALLPARNYPGR